MRRWSRAQNKSLNRLGEPSQTDTSDSRNGPSGASLRMGPACRVKRVWRSPSLPLRDRRDADFPMVLICILRKPSDGLVVPFAPGALVPRGEPEKGTDNKFLGANYSNFTPIISARCRASAQVDNAAAGGLSFWRLCPRISRQRGLSLSVLFSDPPEDIPRRFVWFV